MIQQTSLDSWDLTLPELGLRQRQVYDALFLRSSTNRELSVRLGLPINSVTPRVKELRDKGFVTENRIKHDDVTDRNVVEWRLK